MCVCTYLHIGTWGNITGTTAVVVVVVAAAVVVVVVVVVVELWLVTSVEAGRFYEGQPVVADCLYHRVTYHNVI